MRISILVRVLAPYAVSRFRALQSLGLFETEVLALGRSEHIREWTVADEAINFPYAEAIPSECVDEARPRALRRALVGHLERRDPDVVVVSGYGDRILRTGFIWGNRRKKVTILLSATTAVDRPRFWAKEWLKSVLLRRCDAVFVGGERAAQYLGALGMPANRIWRRMNVVDNEWFACKGEEQRAQQMRARMLYSLPERYFLYVGRFAAEKNLFRLLEAFGRYRSSSADRPWDLVLVGSGPDRQAIDEHIRRNDVPGVVFSGFRQIAELPAFYALAGCLVLPSLSESWGLVVNEAMAAGRPVLVSERCGCVPELVHPGLNGSVFDPLDVKELARLMMFMASERVDLKAMGKESRRIISLYSPGSWAQSLADCIQRTVARKRNQK